MKSKVLLDTNVVIRFFVQDNQEMFQKSQSVMNDIASGKCDAVLLDLIIAEIIYVMQKVYRVEKVKIVDAVKLIISYDHMHVDNQLIILKALNLYMDKNIDFADAILCAKNNLEGYQVMSFDKDIKKCTKKV